MGGDWEQYITNLKATGSCDAGVIIGLPNGEWWAGNDTEITADEGWNIVQGFENGGEQLRASGILLAGKKFMYLRNDEEMMAGKSGQTGITIYKCATCVLIGTYNEEMSPANSSKEVGKMADYLKDAGY